MSARNGLETNHALAWYWKRDLWGEEITPLVRDLPSLAHAVGETATARVSGTMRVDDGRYYAHAGRFRWRAWKRQGARGHAGAVVTTVQWWRLGHACTHAHKITGATSLVTQPTSNLNAHTYTRYWSTLRNVPTNDGAQRRCLLASNWIDFFLGHLCPRFFVSVNVGEWT